MRSMVLASRSARGTPRRRTPTSPRSVLPLLYSIISWASRTSVRSISEADMSCTFSRTAGLRSAWELINAASYALGALCSKNEMPFRRKVEGNAGFAPDRGDGTFGKTTA